MEVEIDFALAEGVSRSKNSKSSVEEEDIDLNILLVIIRKWNMKYSFVVMNMPNDIIFHILSFKKIYTRNVKILVKRGLSIDAALCWCLRKPCVVRRKGSDLLRSVSILIFLLNFSDRMTRWEKSKHNWINKIIAGQMEKSTWRLQNTSATLSWHENLSTKRQWSVSPKKDKNDMKV